MLPTMIDILSSSERYHRANLPELSVLIVGIPNVGKSSMINVLRNKSLKIKGKATAVGNMPGVTRSVLQRIRINDKPLVYLVDTPGVMTPNLTNMHIGMKLALCATLKDHQVGEAHMASYLLYLLNLNENFSYVDQMLLKEPTERCRDMLINYAIKSNMVVDTKSVVTGQTTRFPDVQMAARSFVSKFRKGAFGKFCLDAIYSKGAPKVMHLD